jgi:hypothetical protein
VKALLVLGGVVLAAAAAAAAPAKTIRPAWVDSQPWEGGHIVYRTTKIWVRGDRFAVTTSITNRTRYALTFRIAPRGTDLYEQPGSFGVAWRDRLANGVIWPHGAPELHAVAATRFSPALPTRIRPGRTWRGTFTGRTRLLRAHREWWIVFGIALAAPTRSDPPPWVKPSYWVSEHTFKT